MTTTPLSCIVFVMLPFVFVVIIAALLASAIAYTAGRMHKDSWDSKENYKPITSIPYTPVVPRETDQEGKYVEFAQRYFARRAYYNPLTKTWEAYYQGPLDAVSGPNSLRLVNDYLSGRMPECQHDELGPMP